MHHINGGLISVIMTYASFLMFHSLLNGSLDAQIVFTKLLWMVLQLLSTLAVHMIISAIGQLYASSIVDSLEREDATGKQAENVIVLSQKNHDDILFTKFDENWLKKLPYVSQDEPSDLSKRFDIHKKLFYCPK